MDRIPITKPGLDKLKAELQHLTAVERPAIQKAIAEARAHGDLRENAEYHAAKERQGFIEGRIQEINGRLPRLHVVDTTRSGSDSIVFGARVTLENLDTGETLHYQIVGPDEANLKENRISFQTPVAKALIGKSVGEVVKVQIPKGQIEVEITGIEYS